MSLKALVFDVDGTLADTEETHRQAFNYAFLQFDLEWEWSKSLYRELLQTSGGKERIARFIATLPAPTAEKARLGQLVPAIHRAKTQLYAELIADGRCRLRPGVVRLLDEARASGIRLAIVSTSAMENVHALLTRHLGSSALRMFSSIACAEHVQQKKPAPDIYRLVLATLGEPANACVAFEDSAKWPACGEGGRAVHHRHAIAVDGRRGIRGCGSAAHAPGGSQHELSPEEAARVGGAWLGLAQLRALHAATTSQAAPEGA